VCGYLCIGKTTNVLSNHRTRSQSSRTQSRRVASDQNGGRPIHRPYGRTHLMNVINAYLDTMFSPYPTTPKMLEAKTELQAMMEDAYQGLISKGVSHNEAVGKVITDFGNLDELAPVLGITAELHPPQSESEPATAAAPAKYA